MWGQGHIMTPCKTALVLIAVLCAGRGWAQDIDMQALKDAIGERTSNYNELVELLDSADGNTALAAFDAMMASGDKSLQEIALTAGFAASDACLRARALWEVLSRRDNFVVMIESPEGGDAKDNKAATIAGSQLSYQIYSTFPEKQCLSLSNSKSECPAGYQATVSGLKVDLISSKSPGLVGAFVLGTDGVLIGKVATMSDPIISFPAKIELR